MPTYDYRCTACSELFEVTRPMGSSEPENCPSCEALAKRVFTPVGVSFKGTGFHNTDYRAKPAEDKPACSSAKKGDEGCSSCPSAS